MRNAKAEERLLRDLVGAPRRDRAPEASRSPKSASGAPGRPRMPPGVVRRVPVAPGPVPTTLDGTSLTVPGLRDPVTRARRAADLLAQSEAALVDRLPPPPTVPPGALGWPDAEPPLGRADLLLVAAWTVVLFFVGWTVLGFVHLVHVAGGWP